MIKQSEKHTLVAVALLGACCLPAQAQTKPSAAVTPLATTSPLKVLYYFPGLLDSGPPSSSGFTTATVIHCSSFSTAVETLRFQVRDFNATVKATKSWNVPATGTVSVATHDTGSYLEDGLLNTGLVRQGMAIVQGTTDKVVCRAEVIHASSVMPFGWELHGIRFFPVANTLQ